MSIPASCIEQIKLDEGFRGKPYLDTVGKTTIGYGRNLDDNPLIESEAGILLLNDLWKCEIEAKTLSYYQDLSQYKKNIIINMIFNLGFTRFKGFKKMNKALECFDYATAAIEMLDSKWARQVGKRAQRLAMQMRIGE